MTSYFIFFDFEIILSFFSLFAEKINSSQLIAENFEQYINLVQNDVQMKLDTMKSHMDKYAQHFIENLKNMKKEVQKY